MQPSLFRKFVYFQYLAKKGHLQNSLFTNILFYQLWLKIFWTIQFVGFSKLEKFNKLLSHEFRFLYVTRNSVNLSYGLALTAILSFCHNQSDSRFIEISMTQEILEIQSYFYIYRFTSTGATRQCKSINQACLHPGMPKLSEIIFQRCEISYINVGMCLSEQ